MNLKFSPLTSRISAAITLLSLSFLSSGELKADEFDFVQVNAVQTEYADHPLFTLRGAELRAGKGWGNFFTEVRYRNLEDSNQGFDMEEKRWNLALGYAFPLTSKFRLDVSGNFGDVDLTVSNSQGFWHASTHYNGLTTVLRHNLTEKVDIYGGLEYQSWDLGSDQKAYHLGANYKINALSLGAEYTKYSDSDAINLVARYNF